MTSPGDRSLEVEVGSLDTVRKLYELFDEMGLTHKFSEENGELEVCIHGVWLLFYLDHRTMGEMKLEDEAFEDAQRIAEGYWRQ